MSEALSELEILALDCQASGASPVHGDLLELGWAVCRPGEPPDRVHSRWIVPRTNRRIGRAVRELTGWSEACVAEAIDERDAWTALRGEVSVHSVPTVIHFARFELSFLRDLHQRVGDGSDFPFDAVCLHAVAARHVPDLPRRNIRALAGFLGHSAALERRSAGHVQATAHIWRELLPRLQEASVDTWSSLKGWLEQSSAPPRPKRRTYPLAADRRRALPDRAGVYRFLRSNGDVLYVGKAVSLKKRVAGHFKGGRGPMTERALELLTQVHDIHHTETPTLLEAALLETDEIKRLDPPYNVQLRLADRCAWFASRDFRSAVPAPDDEHRVGPLPSERALLPLSGLTRLAEGAEASAGLRACALAVPTAFAPDPELFAEGWRAFAADFLAGEAGSARKIEQASLALWLERRRSEDDAGSEDAAPDVWDLARVRRRLERSLVQAGLLARRSRWLCLLADADVAFREPGASEVRVLVVADGELVARHEVDAVTALGTLPARRPRPFRVRQGCFEIARYDRLRVLLTELLRIQAEGGEVALRVSGHCLFGARLAALMRAV